MVKIPWIIQSIAMFIAFLVLISATGWICSESGVMGNYPPVTTRFMFQVQVIDPNGTAMPDQTVYAIASLQKPAGLLAPAGYPSNASLSGTTDKYGFAELETGNLTLTRGDIIWMGVSTNKSLLEADLATLTFDSGRIGKWGRYNYSDFDIHEPATGGFARIFFVRNSDGRMIDISQFYQESGLSFQSGQLNESFRYMDNRSWAYPLK